MATRTRITPEPSHEAVILYAMRKAKALKEFDVNKVAARMLRDRQARAEYRRKVT